MPTIIKVVIDEVGLAYFTNRDMAQEQILIMSTDDFARVGAVMTSIDMYPEIYKVDTFYESAKSALNKEQFSNFIVDIQTSFEVFVRNTHRLILKKEGKSVEEIEKCSSYPFRNVIEQHMSRYLKEDLGYDTNTYINEWYTKIYKVRNAIVHNGRQYINGNEAYKAIDAYEEVRNFLSDLLQREGYLNEDGKLDLKLFKKNEFNVEDSKELIESMKEKGLVDKDLPLKIAKYNS